MPSFTKIVGSWVNFLNNLNEVRRPMVDLGSVITADELDFYTDASRNQALGMGGYFQDEFFTMRWEKGLIKLAEPSIGFLELYATCTGIFIWGERLRNSRVTIFIDNESAMHMINNQVSNCKFCMRLLRLLMLNCLNYNTRVFARWVKTEKNSMADSLLRFDWKRFWKLTPASMKNVPMSIPVVIWPPSKFFKQIDEFF